MDLEFKVWLEADEREPWKWGTALKNVAGTALQKVQPFLQRFQHGPYGYSPGERFIGAAIDTARGEDPPFMAQQKNIEQQMARHHQKQEFAKLIKDVFPSYTSEEEINKLNKEGKFGEALVRTIFDFDRNDFNNWVEFRKADRMKDSPTLKSVNDMLNKRLQMVLNDPEIQKIMKLIDNYSVNPDMQRYVGEQKQKLYAAYSKVAERDRTTPEYSI